jgi:hypothetical protein
MSWKKRNSKKRVNISYLKVINNFESFLRKKREKKLVVFLFGKFFKMKIINLAVLDHECCK